MFNKKTKGNKDMKTIYLAPTMKVVVLRAKNQLLANSIAVGATYNGETVLSRKGGFFDDEDEE